MHYHTLCMTLGELGPTFLYVFGVAMGLLWGSFLNVVIYRVPRGQSVVTPASHCGACGKPIRMYDNVPILSYLLLRGKARCCGAPFSPRYLLVEAIGGAIGGLLAYKLLGEMGADASVIRYAAVYGSFFALCLGLVAAAFIDMEHMILPDSITLGGAILGVGTASLRDMSIVQSVVGAGLGFVVVWLPFIVVYPRLRGRAGMGMGDAKLLMLAGAWFGALGAVLVLFAGALQGTLGAAITLLVRGRIEDPIAVQRDLETLERAAEAGDDEALAILKEDPLAVRPDGIMTSRVPFGPFLILGCLEHVFLRGFFDRLSLRWLGPLPW